MRTRGLVAKDARETNEKIKTLYEEKRKKKMFVPRISGRIAPNDIIVNSFVPKIKIEADYITSVKVENDCDDENIIIKSITQVAPKRKRRKSYQCSFYDKQFPKQLLLNIHYYSHTGEMPNFCKLCNRAFSQVSGLIPHIQIHHNAPSFHCQICGKSFALNKGLISHQNAHNGFRPFKGDQCDKSFFFTKRT